MGALHSPGRSSTKIETRGQIMENIYTSGQYLETTQTWHAEDSPWKAKQIKAIIDKKLY